MKSVVSVSLGSSKGDREIRKDFLGVPFSVIREGTDGDMETAVNRIRQLDGQVDAIGLGGIDLYIVAGKRRYVLRDAKKLAEAAKITPIVDGSGLKNTLERRVVDYLYQQGIFQPTQRVLLVSGVDRFGMAEAFEKNGASVLCGDFIFVLGLPLPLRSLKSVSRVGAVILPFFTKLPFKWLYPTGESQDKKPTTKFDRYYQESDIIAGDFHFIKKYLPERLDGKIILTNTVRKEQVVELKKRGLAMLITTTPEFGGDSFGTNLMEAIIIALSEKKPEEMTAADYEGILDQLGWVPRVTSLQD